MSAGVFAPVLPGGIAHEASEPSIVKDTHQAGLTGAAPEGGLDSDELEVISARQWLTEALRLERVAISENLASRHKDLMTQWMLRFDGRPELTERTVSNGPSDQPIRLSPRSGQPHDDPDMKAVTKDAHLEAAEPGVRSSGADAPGMRSLSVAEGTRRKHGTLEKGRPHGDSPKRTKSVAANSELCCSDGAGPRVPRRTSSTPSVASCPSEVARVRSRFRAFNRVTRAESVFFSESEEGMGRCCRALEPIVSSPKFESVFAMVIVANSVMMCIRAQYTGLTIANEQGFPGHIESTEHSWPKAIETFEACETLFGMVYLVEVVLKALGLQIKFLKDLWCWFDVIIVATWIYSLFSYEQTVDPALLRALRLLRLLRLVRLLKAFHAFDVLHLLVASLRASFNVFVWSIAFLIVVMMLFALFIGTVLEPYFEDSEQPERFEVWLHFGTFTRAMMSIWYVTLANPQPTVFLLVNNVSHWFMALFFVHHTVLGFAIITVVRAVFLRETLKVSQTDEELMIREKERQISKNAHHMVTLFENGDLDGDGILSYQDFQNLVRDPRMQTFMSALELEVRDAEEVFMLLDINGEGELCINTLMEGFTRLKGGARSLDVVQMMHLLRRLETDLSQIHRHMNIPQKRKKNNLGRLSLGSEASRMDSAAERSSCSSILK